MSLTRQTITIASRGGKLDKLTITMPAQHVYPFILHRSLTEYHEKKAGDRRAYSKKVVISHLFTGFLVAVCKNYENAHQMVNKLKNRPIFLMPTVDTMKQHEDWADTARLVGKLKERYAIEQLF